MYGFTGNILIVDVTQKSFKIKHQNEAYYKKYIGGALLAAALFEGLTDGQGSINAFSSENPVIFATGPMAGDKVCGATRVNILSLAPESTEIYLSQAGGEFGPALKRAGYDALAVFGISDIPVVLEIDNDHIQFKQAGPLWGLDRVDARRQIMTELGDDFATAVIGPAGERLVRHANIMFEPDHYAGRGGLGAVLGAKRIKAIAVRGDREVVFKDSNAIKEINKKGGQRLAVKTKASPDSFMATLRDLGTFGLLELNRKSGNLPTRNFRSGSPNDPGSSALLRRDAASEIFAGRRNPCKNCFVACKKKSKSHPDYTSLAEYESAAILGPNIGLENDPETCLLACELCNRLGMDTISTGNLIAWLMDCFGKGVLDEKTAGFSIAFGDSEKVIELIKNMAFRKGMVGKLLADGIDRAVSEFGPQTKPLSRFIRGIGMPAHMPTKKPGVGFGYMHGPNLSDHMKLEHDWIASDDESLSAFGLSVRSAPESLDAAKIDVAKATQLYYAAMDCLSLCLFVFGPGNVYNFDELMDMINAATGFSLSFNELMEIGERAVQLQRKLFIRFGGADEKFLDFLAEKIPDGPSKGAKIDKQDFDSARQHYYAIMGWDEQGRPRPETLERLGI